MSTRSRIGLLLETGYVLSVYHHWDGYSEWLGVTLQEQYNTYEKVAELIDGGNMSSCYSDNVYDYEKQEYVKRDPQPEYYGGDDEQPRLDTTVEDYLDNGEEYAYLFENNQWVCYDLHYPEPQIVEIKEKANVS